MALSFVPLRNVKTVNAQTNLKATFILNGLQEVAPAVIAYDDPTIAGNDPDQQTPNPYDYELVPGVDCVQLVRIERRVQDEPALDESKGFKFYWGAGNNVNLITLPDGTKVSWDSVVVDNLPSPYFDDNYLYGTNLSFLDLAPLYATDVYLTVVPTVGSGSNFKDKYYVVAVDLDTDEPGIQWGFFFDKDIQFNNPQPANNTRGPYLPGDDFTVDVDGDGIFTPGVDRLFRIFVQHLDDSTEEPGDDSCGYALGMMEMLFASCCSNEFVYDYSVESDLEPAYFGDPNQSFKNPFFKAHLSSGTSPRGQVSGDIDMVKEIHQSTASPYWLLGSTTFFNLKIKTRGFLDLELFSDSRDDNNNTDGALTFTVPNNSKDDYSYSLPGGVELGSDFMGAKDRLQSLDSIGYFMDSLTGNIVWVLDVISNGTLDSNDYYLYPTSNSFAPFYTTWKLGTLIDPGDINLVNPPHSLNLIAVASVIDDNNNGTLYEFGEHVVPRQNWNYEYPIEDNNMALEKFEDGQVSTIYGDFRGIDIPVLPGTLPIEVHWYDALGTEVTTLKVEQTYTVTVKVNCDLPSYAKIVAEIRVPGQDGTQDVIAVALFNPGVKEVTFHNVTPWRGTRGWDNVRYSVRSVEVRVYADFYTQLDKGPYDGFYGSDEMNRFLNDPFVYHYVRSPGSNVNGQYNMADAYDCFNRARLHVNPEDLVVKANRECISKLDQVYPNLMLSISNVDNPIDANDPFGPIMSDRLFVGSTPFPLFAWVDASGGGIKGLALGKITDGNGNILNKFILQINENGTVTSWLWSDANNNNIYDPGETLTLKSDPNFPSLDIYKWMDINGNGTIDTSDWLDYNLNQTMDTTEFRDLNQDGFVDTLEWLDINGDNQIDL
ncbi:MAG: hypothetical protein ACUVT3_10630, partial [Ignavibacterium sp.]